MKESTIVHFDTFHSLTAGVDSGGCRKIRDGNRIYTNLRCQYARIPEQVIFVLVDEKDSDVESFQARIRIDLNTCEILNLACGASECGDDIGVNNPCRSRSCDFAACEEHHGVPSQKMWA